MVRGSRAVELNVEHAARGHRRQGTLIEGQKIIEDTRPPQDGTTWHLVNGVAFPAEVRAPSIPVAMTADLTLLVELDAHEGRLEGNCLRPEIQGAHVLTRGVMEEQI